MGEDAIMLRVQCKKHPRYTGERSPRASCEQCLTLHKLRLAAIEDRLTIVGAKPTAREAQAE
jgi:hypothetical protein